MEELIKAIREVGAEVGEENIANLVRTKLEEVKYYQDYVVENYCKKDINYFLNELSKNTWSVKRDGKEIEDTFGLVMAKIHRDLRMIACACSSTKIHESRKDAALLADQLRKTANELDALSELEKEEKTEIDLLKKLEEILEKLV